jgi:hypothetical protein
MLGTCFVTLLSIGGYFSRKLFSVLSTAIEDLKTIKETQITQASNHLSHIEGYTLETRDAMREPSVKFDVLIAVMEKK